MSHHRQAKETGLGEAAAELVCPQQNHLLAALPAAERERLLPALKLVYLPLGSVLYESGDRLRHMYFPTDCIVSLLHVLKNGASAGIAAVGNDGAIGVALFTGGETMTNRAVVQSAGFAYRLTSGRLKQEFERHGELFHVLLRYGQALITQMAQTVVCNRHHSVDQQLCRWLLVSLDRLPSNKLTMTQELIANILGVRREGVTEAAGRLQKQGVIQIRARADHCARPLAPGTTLLRMLQRGQEGDGPSPPARSTTGVKTTCSVSGEALCKCSQHLLLCRRNQPHGGEVR